MEMSTARLPLLAFYISYSSVTVIKRCHQRQLKEERICSSLQFQGQGESHHEGVKAQRQEQEAERHHV